MIYISIDVNGAPSPKEIKIGNQWENLDETIQFSFPESFSQLHKYAVACTYRKDTKERISRIFPLTDGRLVISSLITSLPGLWNIYTFCKSSEVDLDAKSIDLRAKNGEHISISDAITARVNANNIDIDSIKNVDMDPNIKIIYDDLFDFKIELENNEAARKTNESLRKQSEALRVNAESERESAEQSRNEHESARAENENARKKSETIRVESEKARVNAESNRSSAERQRVEAESSRINAEQSRSDAESLRVTAESKRATDTAASLKKIDDTVKKYSYIDECIDLQKAMGITVVDGCLCMYDDN